MNNMTWIIWYTEVVQHVEVLEANNIGCQILHIVVHYFLVCNYFWMFCEGLHLHTLMVFAFVQENKIFKWFCVIGWVLPLILITIYSSVRASISKEAVYCWIEESPTFYIITVPVCISMLLNVIFLVNIVRVLVTKLRAANSPETHQTKKAVRATLILLPLLGLHYLVTPFRPDPGTRGEVVYEIIATIVTSFQGFCVALIFCFFNGEVVALWKKKWMRSRLNRGKDMRVSYAATTLSEYQVPVSLQGYKAPISSQDNKAPVSLEGYKAPVSLQDYKAPVSLQDYKAPVSLEGYKAPVSLQDYKAPVSLQDYKAPVSLEGYKAPVSLQDYKAPVSLQDYKAPVSLEGYKAPVSLQDYKAPVSLQDYKAPVSLEGYKAPVSLQDYKAPQPSTCNVGLSAELGSQQ
ncbi:calcitonin gene-related peptide type 1 receptor-like [Centruroides sculpturatus]|uniref:calcitonin gene-related peptide type 1 receptor-like n=1 Tax=Centruroides sculpturatus TaxID=218467 RepID=UPI000C6ECF8A|nr:calcitonin gene-related peptide type 1 receptor-like [Centruroides sculpturatus]